MAQVTLEQMLAAREARVQRQKAFLARYGCTLISYAMNIAGPVKDTPLYRRAFFYGMRQLRAALRAARISVLAEETSLAETGCEAILAVGASAASVKRLCCAIEDDEAVGRLFDMDVLDADGRKLTREEIGRGTRACIVCDAPGRGCASRRLHSVGELQRATNDLLERHFAAADRRRIAALATAALLSEVCVTPKPGLVDRANNGSHRDMDIFTFSSGIAALAPFWERFAAAGQETADAAPEETFDVLRAVGRRAERDMFAATGGINTHKGAIFLLGTLCGAAGRLWRADAPCRDSGRLLSECAVMAEASVREDWRALRAGGEAHTVGETLYLSRGIGGIRGEMATGLPAVAETALPVLRAALRAGMSRNDAGVAALMHLIGRGGDTNMIHRGGAAAAEAAAAEARKLLAEGTPLLEAAARLDRRFVEQNISPGGCSDQLAAAWFLLDWEQEESEEDRQRN